MVDKSPNYSRSRYSLDLPDDQIDWFLSQSQEMTSQVGESYSRQGDPADAMFVVLEGQVQGRGELGGETCDFR